MASIFLVFYSLKRSSNITFLSYFSSRFNRIYIGFLFWSVMYYAIRLISAGLLSKAPPSISIIILFWDGTAHHFWFLPFIFLASIAGFLVQRITRNLHVGYWIILGICAFLGLGLAVIYPVETLTINDYTARLSFAALPSVFLGISFTMAYNRLPAELFDRPLLTSLGLLLWIGGMALLFAYGRNNLLETLSGFGLLLASLNHFKTPFILRFARYGGYSLGIYIIHLFFVEGYQDAARLIGWYPAWHLDITVFILTILSCAGVLLFIKKRMKFHWWLF